MMKKALLTLLAVGMTGAALSCHGEAAIALENFTVNSPVYYGPLGTPIPASPDVWVQVFAAPAGTTEASQFIALSPPFNLVMDGFFNNGIGIVPGVPDNGQVAVVLQAWYNATSCETSGYRAVAFWEQKAGANPEPPARPTPAPLTMPQGLSFTTLRPPPCFPVPVPEPGTAALMLFGAGALLGLCRRK